MGKRKAAAAAGAASAAAAAAPPAKRRSAAAADTPADAAFASVASFPDELVERILLLTATMAPASVGRLLCVRCAAICCPFAAGGRSAP